MGPAVGPIAEIRLDLLDDFLLVEITPDRDLDIFRVAPLAVEFDEIVAGNRVDRGVFRVTGVDGFFAVDHVVEFAERDSLRVVVAA